MPAPPSNPKPWIAIVGRPNVGKSTLFNRLTRTRRALVGDEPGMTRDRMQGTAEWRGVRFGVTDTGGILPESREFIPQAILRQAQVAMESATAILFVVDGRSDLAAPDLQLAQMLRRTGKPVLLLVNKVESERQEGELATYHRLGFEPVYPISAEHGRGLEEPLDAVLALLPAATLPEEAEAAETRVAIIGRPNVGKSTLLNQLAGEERAIVSPIAGTTRDTVDAQVELGGARYRILDTAGLRRKGATRLMAEKLSVVMARKHLEGADLALMLLDGSEPEEQGVLALDATIAGYAYEERRSVILAVNKWDRARGLRRTTAAFTERIRERLKFLAFAPVVYLSAQEGTGIPRLITTMARVSAERRKRIPTAELNRFLATVDFDRARVPLAHRLRIYYISQVAVAPPQFVIFVDRPRKMHFSYERFLENQLRRAFGFEGSPIVLKTRVSKG